MITQATLNNPTMQARIYAAMRWATIAATSDEYPVDTGHFNITQLEKGKRACVYVRNSKGRHYMRVDYHRGEAQAFSFYAAADNQHKCGYEITETVYKSLRSA